VWKWRKRQGLVMGELRQCRTKERKFPIDFENGKKTVVVLRGKAMGNQQDTIK